MLFINFVITGELELRNVKKKNLILRLIELKIKPFNKITKIISTKIAVTKELTLI